MIMKNSQMKRFIQSHMVSRGRAGFKVLAIKPFNALVLPSAWFFLLGKTARQSAPWKRLYVQTQQRIHRTQHLVRTPQQGSTAATSGQWTQGPTTSQNLPPAENQSPSTCSFMLGQNAGKSAERKMLYPQTYQRNCCSQNI